MPRALSIYLPRWAVQLATRRRRQTRDASARRDAPVTLLVAAERGVDFVADCCAKAEAVGVRSGMTLAHARGLLVGGVADEQPSQPEHDREQLRRLAQWMLRFSPTVALQEPDGLLLDISGCERLFGGEERHVRMIAAALQRLRLVARAASAPTVGCAWAVARYGALPITRVAENTIRAALEPLPIEALRFDAASCAALQEVGVQRVGELLRLPRADLAARFDAAVLQRIDQALGNRPEHLTPIEPPQPLEAEHEFDGPIRRSEIVEEAVRRLLADVLEQLAARGLGARRLELEFRRVDADPVRMTFALTHPSRDAQHLWRLIHARLESLHLGWGVEAVGLRVRRAIEATPEQLTLWADDARAHDDRAALGALLDQLIERFGAPAVMRAAWTETHAPEDAFHLTPFATTQPVKHAAEVTSASRPARLFEQAEAARVIAVAPDGPPGWIEWRGVGACVLAYAGPERIAPSWWRNADAAPSARDYYAIHDARGRLLWIYRSCASGEWRVQGRWA